MREAFLTGAEAADTQAVEPQAVDALALTVVPEREVVLSKVKLDKVSNLYAEYTLRENGVSSEITKKVHEPAHEDLVKAMKKLTVHLCLMTEVVDGIRREDEFLAYHCLLQSFMSEDIYAAPEFETYTCTAFTLSSGGVTLIGQKKLRSKKVLNLVSPFEVFDPETPTGDEYQYLAELDYDLNAVVEEVKAYLDGKYAKSEESAAEPEPSKQLGIFDDIEQQVNTIAKQQQARQQAASELGYTVSVQGKDGQWKDRTSSFVTATRSINGQEVDSE